MAKIQEKDMFRGNFGQYRVQFTKDGSPTLWSEDFNETCHSMEGAEVETDLYYVKGCRVAQRGPLVAVFPLLEIGFGLGVGYERTIRELEQEAPSTRLFYLSVERDEELVLWGSRALESQSQGQAQTQYPLRSHLQPSSFLGLKAYTAEAPQGTLVVLVGDAREVIQKLLLGGHQTLPHFLAIYQDAFSPRKNPLLWTVEWFTALKALSDPDCVLSTFSASSRFRKALLGAGWAIHEGARLPPRKAASTLATLQGPSQSSLLERLSRSPVGPLTDENCQEFLL